MGPWIHRHCSSYLGKYQYRPERSRVYNTPDHYGAGRFPEQGDDYKYRKNYSDIGRCSSKENSISGHFQMDKYRVDQPALRHKHHSDTLLLQRRTSKDYTPLVLVEECH